MTFVIISSQNRAFTQYTGMKKKRRGKPAKRKSKSLATLRKKPGKPAKRKSKVLAVIRSEITLIAELGSIAGFLIAVYNLLKELI